MFLGLSLAFFLIHQIPQAFQMPSDFATSLLRAVVALFIIVDPVGNIPILITLTESMAADERMRAFHIATLVSLVLLIVFAVVGQQVLNIFGISIYSFMIAGGALLLILAMRILVFGSKVSEVSSTESVGAVPIACPLLVGPGAITTIIVILQTSGMLITVLSVILNLLVIWIVLRFIEPIHRFLGRTGSSVIARIMAIFIAAIAVQFMVEGVTHYFYAH